MKKIITRTPAKIEGLLFGRKNDVCYISHGNVKYNGTCGLLPMQ